MLRLCRRRGAEAVFGDLVGLAEVPAGTIEAIERVRRAVFPEGRPPTSTELATAVSGARSLITEESLRPLSDEWRAQVALLASVAFTLGYRASGFVADLQEAIACLTIALDLMSVDDAGRVDHLTNRADRRLRVISTKPRCSVS